MKERAGIIFGIGGCFLLVKPYFDMKEILPVFEKMIHECYDRNVSYKTIKKANAKKTLILHKVKVFDKMVS